MFVASNRNPSPLEHRRAAVEHIHHANPSETGLGPPDVPWAHMVTTKPVLLNGMGSSPCPQ